jgi:hypothetical protein
VSWPEPRSASGFLGKLRGDDGPMHLSWSPRPRFSPNGEAIAVQDHVGNLAFIDTATFALHPTPRAFGRAFIEDLAWLPDGNHVLVGSSDNSLAVWRARPLEGVMRIEAIGELPPDAWSSAPYLAHAV